MMQGFRHTGRVSVDLALTGGEGPEFARFERLHGPEDLDAWLAANGLGEGVGSRPADLRAARALRWAIWWAVQAGLAGRPVAAEDAEVIERVAGRAPLVPRLDGDGWREPTAPAALSHVARDAIALLADPGQRARLRVCAAPDCVVPFYDDSRPGRRRWCEDRRCGDRMRQRAARERRRS